MISDYFEDWKVRSEFKPEFISPWAAWLGEENYHELNEITEIEWSRFNTLVKLIFKGYELYHVNVELKSMLKVEHVESYLPSYKDAMSRDSSKFTRLIIPELLAVLTEDWDFTYILWHKNNGAKEKLSPLIKQAKLFHFNEKEN
jgi:hypothetical protein